MRIRTLAIPIAIALSAVFVAACDRPSTQPTGTQRGAAKAPEAPPPTAVAPATPTTPANAGTPSAAEKEEGSKPVQGQVDPKQPDQQRDFEKKDRPASG